MPVDGRLAPATGGAASRAEDAGSTQGPLGAFGAEDEHKTGW